MLLGRLQDRSSSWQKQACRRCKGPASWQNCSSRWQKPSAKAELASAKKQAEQQLQRSQQAQQQLNKELVICEQQVSCLGGSSIILTSRWSL